METKGLLQSLGDIIKGYSEAKYLKKRVYLKHFSLLDQAEFEKLYDFHYQRAKARNVHTDESMLKFCMESDLWTEQREAEIKTLRKTIESLNFHKKKAILPSQLESTVLRIKNEKKKLNGWLAEKREVLGLTCEVFAEGKMNNHYVHNAFYLDPNFKKKLFSDEDFEELTKEDLFILIAIYNISTKKYDIKEIKKIAISNFFQNYYSLCNDNVVDFFGKPVVELTIYQSRIASYGRYFKSLLSSVENIPNNIAEDPDKLVDYIEMSRNRDSKIGGNQNTNVGVIGATKKDLEALKGEYDVDDTHQKAKASGKKSLNMRDLLNLQGEKK